MPQMRQEAEYPMALRTAYEDLKVYDGWSFELKHITRGQGSVGLTFSIFVSAEDAHHPGHMAHVQHPFIVPAAAYNAETWERWLRDRCLDVLGHELGEHFRIGTRRPFQPLHGDGQDPYVVPYYPAEADRDTSSTQAVKLPVPGELAEGRDFCRWVKASVRNSDDVVIVLSCEDPGDHPGRQHTDAKYGTWYS